MLLQAALATALAGAIALVGGVARAQSADALRIGVEGAYPPFSWVEPDGEVVGFDIDIAFALCAEMGRECELVQQDWDGMIPALIAGRFDAVVASMSITEERMLRVDFTDKYYYTRGVFVAPEGSKLELTPEGLAGRRIGVQGATTYECYLETHFPDAEIVPYPNQEVLFQDLVLGRLAAQMSDEVSATLGFLDTEAGEGFAIVGGEGNDVDCLGVGSGIAVRKGEDALREALNDAIHAIRENGVYAEINDSYFDFDIYGD